MLNKNNERALVYLANVDEIQPLTFLNGEGELEEAANIEILITGGWKLIVQKNRFEVHNLFVFCEVDTILPVDIPTFAFLEGKRIRTKKLKGVVSQGVAFTIPEIIDVMSLTTFGTEHYRFWEDVEFEIGNDWTELVKATKYDEYSNNGRKGDGVKLPPANARGAFPSFIHKTDEERIQNLAKELKYDWQGKEVVITEKLDGSSITLYARKQENLVIEDVIDDGFAIGICSRNLDLKLFHDNHFCNVGRTYLDRLLDYCESNSRSLALQGEIIGPGIQGNPYRLTEHKIYFFNVFDIDTGRKLTHYDAYTIMQVLDVKAVPYVGTYTIANTMEEAIESADGGSVLNPKTNREGIVVRALDGSFSFKVISNKWLLKEKE